MPEVDHRVDVGVRRRRCRAPRGSCRASRRRRGRSGCCGSSAPARARRSSSRRSRRAARQLEPGGRARVGREHAPAARGREHDHAPAARQRLRRERGRPLVGLLDRRRAQRAPLAADAVEDAVVARERAGVARGRALALGRDAALHAARAACARVNARSASTKRAPSAHALEVGERDRGLRDRRRSSRGSRRAWSARSCRTRSPC